LNRLQIIAVFGTINSIDTTMKIKKNVAISESGFIFDASRGYSYSTNGPGGEIIGWLKEGKSQEEILNALLDAYQTDKPTAEKDLDDFINVLQQFNLIEHEDQEA
jgi:hypothetical protein